MTDLNVNKPRTHAPKEHVSLSGTGKPGSKVTVEGLRDGMGKPVKMRANVRDDGIWGVSGMAPDKEGIETISVKSSGATTTTTYEVRTHGRPPTGRKK